LEANLRVLVYTSIFGNYDSLKDQEQQNIDCDFLHFSSPHEELGDNPRLQAKYYKVLPHRLLGNGMGYDYTIWIDGSIQVESPKFAEYMVSQAKDSWAMFKHPWRDCIYQEIAEAHDMKKYLDQPMIEQGCAYEEDCMPKNYGLQACTIICRNTKNLEVMGLCELWWREILKWGIKDQVSLPYVLHKNNSKVNICDKPLLESGLFTIHAAHRAEEYRKCKP
jgi:hypothetical protein